MSNCKIQRGELGKNWVCVDCGMKHGFSLFAVSHWNTTIAYKCGCGTKYRILQGKIERVDG